MGAMTLSDTWIAWTWVTFQIMKITWSPPVMKNYKEWNKSPIDIELWFALTLIWTYDSIAYSYIRRIVEQITLGYNSTLRRKTNHTYNFLFAHYYHFYYLLLCIPSYCIVSPCIYIYQWDLVAETYWKINFIVNMVHFHLSLSGCCMGSLETCTHVIPMPKSHIVTLEKFYTNVIPSHENKDKNVVISRMHQWKGNKNVEISDQHSLWH